MAKQNLFSYGSLCMRGNILIHLLKRITTGLAAELQPRSSVVGFQHCRIEIIPNDQGNRITPSCVAFTDEMRLIGDAAINQASSNSVNTIFVGILNDALEIVDNAPRSANTGTSDQHYLHSNPTYSEPKNPRDQTKAIQEYSRKPSRARKIAKAALQLTSFILTFAAFQDYCKEQISGQSYYPSQQKEDTKPQDSSEKAKLGSIHLYCSI
ncbi:hypothetical protein MRB53_011080 [Persea americana]|uniref:Uncharacterized protein n=1 Tax=Persea americana TaxID=3435 RepID=A0ACC2LUG3_PERAE|nr:hypothetical protein MRB53_011080 [Persea americana]